MIDELEFLEGIIISRIERIECNGMYNKFGLSSQVAVQVAVYENVLREIREIKEMREINA